MEWDADWICQICSHKNRAVNEECEKCVSSSESKKAAWEWHTNTRWLPYDSDINTILEKAHLAGKTAVNFKIAGTTYQANFLDMEQVNEKTQFPREIRRVSDSQSPPKRQKLSKLFQKELTPKKKPRKSSSKSPRGKKSGSPSKSSKRTTTDVNTETAKKILKKRKSKVKFTPKKKQKSSPTKTPLPPTAPHPNYNEHITTILYELSKNERNTGQHHKANAYAKAATSLKKFDRKVTSGDDAKKLPGIGKSIALKIQEIIDTGGLGKLETAKEDTHLQAINELCRVYGIGPKIAGRFVNVEKITTLAQLSQNQHLLNDSQKIGLKHVKDFEIRIPRDEIVEIETVVKDTAKEIDSKLELETCGSYRRGAKTCGDIDVLITHPDYSTENFNDGKKVFTKLLNALHKTNFLTDDLASGPSKYMGVCKLSNGNGQEAAEVEKNEAEIRRVDSEFKFEVPKFDEDSDTDEEPEVPRTAKYFKPSGDKAKDTSTSSSSSSNPKSESPGTGKEEADDGKSGSDKSTPKCRLHRRIDLRFLPCDAYPAGILYFTGSDSFNRDMRQHAIEKCFTINEHGIYPILETEKNKQGATVVTSKGDPEKIKTEQDIFKIIDFAWVEPQNRNW